MKQNKEIYFLCGLPRSGSTLLGSIMAQNPAIHVTPTSPLYTLLVSTNECFNMLDIQYTFDKLATQNRVYKEMIRAFYSDIEKPIIFDKHRCWPKHVDAIKEYMNVKPRFICPVRPIAEIITSYLVLADKDPNNFIDQHLRAEGKPIDNEARAFLLWSVYMKDAYEALKEGLIMWSKYVLLVDYRDIVYGPQKVLKSIHRFCDIAPYDYSFENIENKCAEAKDAAWGMQNLHTIRPRLKMQSANPLEYLPSNAIAYFEQFDIDKIKVAA